MISGLGFTRFTVALEPQPAFSEHPEAPRWERIIDRNLCWSGSFKVRGSRYASCRLGEGSRLDMKILLDVQNQQLILTVADVEGVPLFPLMLQLKRNNFRESKLMLMINELTEQLTGIQGILGSTIAFTLKTAQSAVKINCQSQYSRQIGLEPFRGIHRSASSQDGVRTGNPFSTHVSAAEEQPSSSTN